VQRVFCVWAATNNENNRNLFLRLAHLCCASQFKSVFRNPDGLTILTRGGHKPRSWRHVLLNTANPRLATRNRPPLRHIVMSRPRMGDNAIRLGFWRNGMLRFLLIPKNQSRIVEHGAATLSSTCNQPLIRTTVCGAHHASFASNKLANLNTENLHDRRYRCITLGTKGDATRLILTTLARLVNYLQEAGMRTAVGSLGRSELSSAYLGIKSRSHTYLLVNLLDPKHILNGVLPADPRLWYPPPHLIDERLQLIPVRRPPHFSFR